RDRADGGSWPGHLGRVLCRGDGPKQSRALQNGRRDRHQAGGAWLSTVIQQLTPPLGKRQLREYPIAKLSVQVAMNATETYTCPAADATSQKFVFRRELHCLLAPFALDAPKSRACSCAIELFAARLKPSPFTSRALPRAKRPPRTANKTSKNRQIVT